MYKVLIYDDKQPEPLMLSHRDQFMQVEYKELVQYYKLLASAIHDGNQENLEVLVHRLFADMEAIPIEMIQRLVIDLFALLSNQLSDWGLDLMELSRKQLDYQQIMRMKVVSAIKLWSLEMLSLILFEANKKRLPSYDKLIFQVKRYIHDHYNKDLTLEEVADQVLLNPVYFSRLFKQEVGVNFIEYVTRLRMRHAMELLHSGKFKAYEVSSMVGYRSSQYFTKVFKQYTGFTPKTYSRKVNLEECL